MAKKKHNNKSSVVPKSFPPFSLCLAFCSRTGGKVQKKNRKFSCFILFALDYYNVCRVSDFSIAVGYSKVWFRHWNAVVLIRFECNFNLSSWGWPKPNVKRKIIPCFSQNYSFEESFHLVMLIIIIIVIVLFFFSFRSVHRRFSVLNICLRPENFDDFHGFTMIFQFHSANRHCLQSALLQFNFTTIVSLNTCEPKARQRQAKVNVFIELPIQFLCILKELFWVLFLSTDKVPIIPTTKLRSFCRAHLFM